MIPSNVQQDVADEVNNRLTRATQELQAKYERGEGGKDVSVDGPSGAAYKEKEKEEQRARKERRQRAKAENAASDNAAATRDEDDDSEGDEDDHALREMREARLKQLKAAQREKIENIAKGHGQYREIIQDEFLAEVTSSMFVVCHFYHRDFSRCEIMNHHLAKLAPRHVETKFIKIDADKAPFFVEKLKIRTIPSVIVFHDGIAVEKILGFEGLCEEQPKGKEDEWPTIRLARLLAAKKAINGSLIVDDEEVERTQKQSIESLRRAMLSAQVDDDDFDEDLDD